MYYGIRIYIFFKLYTIYIVFQLYRVYIVFKLYRFYIVFFSVIIMQRIIAKVKHLYSIYLISIGFFSLFWSIFSIKLFIIDLLNGQRYSYLSRFDNLTAMLKRLKNKLDPWNFINQIQNIQFTKCDFFTLFDKLSDLLGIILYLTVFGYYSIFISPKFFLYFDISILRKIKAYYLFY